MQIDITKILQAEEGHRETYEVSGERPEIEDVVLKQPVEGSIIVSRTTTGVELLGKLQTVIELECHRCLRTFEHPLEFPLKAEFSERPGEDQFAINDNGSIDLAEALRQDLLVSLPIRQLCQADCKGIELS